MVILMIGLSGDNVKINIISKIDLLKEESCHVSVSNNKSFPIMTSITTPKT